MFFLLLIIILLAIWVLGKYILPFWKRYLQLRDEYRDITLLPIASISFVGHLHHVNIDQDLVFKLLNEQSKTCQDQNKGVFCLWNSLRPVVFICSGRGLEVFLVSFQIIYPFYSNRHSSIIANNWSNLLIILCFNLG